MERSIERIPTYALCYLVYGDPTALTDEEIEEIDDMICRRQISHIIPFAEGDEVSNEPYFSSIPFWGLPTEVEDCMVIFNY